MHNKKLLFIFLVFIISLFSCIAINISSGNFLISNNTNLNISLSHDLNNLEYINVTNSFIDIDGVKFIKNNETDKYTWLNINNYSRYNYNIKGNETYQLNFSILPVPYDYTFALLDNEIIEEDTDGTFTVDVTTSNKELEYLYYVFLQVLKEVTNTPFESNETQSMKLFVYCDDNTVEEYSFNTTANDYILKENIECNWDFLKLDVTYAASSYYRTVIPSNTSTNITIYGLDLNEDLASQMIIQINDLTGEFNNGQLEIVKTIAGSSKEIITQKYDIEDKVTLYLLTNGLYTIRIRSEDGTDVRVLGSLIGEAGTKTITIPEINFYPDNSVIDNIDWQYNLTNTSAKLTYIDGTSTTTDSIKFYIYDENKTNIIYNSSATDINNAAFLYNGLSQDYVVCFEAIKDGYRTIEDCQSYLQTINDGNDWSMFNEESLQNYRNFGIVLTACFIVLLFGAANFSIGMLLASIVLTVAKALGWLSLGSDTLTYTILSLCWIITVVGIMINSERR